MNELAIKTRGLTKIFKGFKAVDNLNLEVPRGSIFGFLGPNGAGKTTTIKMLLGLIFPTLGEGKVLGFDIYKEGLEIRKRIGYVSETQGLYGYMKVKEIINFAKESYPNWDERVVKKYVELFNLPLDKKIKALSKGMKTQLGLVLGLGSQPELLILDEPTSGLDPIRTKEFLVTIVDQVAQTGQTVFFSSHHLNEVERIADHVGIISNGQLVLSKPLDELKANQKKIHVVFEGELPEEINNLEGVQSIDRKGRGFVITVEKNAEEILNKINSFMPLSVEVVNETLESIFEDYAGRDKNAAS